MKAFRVCTRQGCQRPAVATLTYSYAEATVVLGPLSTSAQPNTYELCAEHAQSLTVPRGWQVVRLQTEFVPATPNDEDLEALAQIVRKAAKQEKTAQPRSSWSGRPTAESVTGSGRVPGTEYDQVSKQGEMLPPAPPELTGKAWQHGHLRVLPGGMPD